MAEGDRVLELMIEGVQDFGDELLLVQSFSGYEGMSRPFSFNLELLCEQPEQLEAALPDMLGRKVTLRVEAVRGAPRHFNGFVSRFSQSGRDARYARFELEFVAWLAFLGRRRNCRIFQFADVKTILNELFDEWLKRLAQQNFTVDFLATGPFVQRDFCVQYRETDLAFIWRLMEEEGIGYFFEHGADHHTLVLVDDPGQHKRFKLPRPLPLGLSSHREVEAITSWSLDQEQHSGWLALRDQHMERPRDPHERQEATVAPNAPAEHEIYDFSGGYAKRFIGKDRAGSERLGELSDLAGRMARLGMEEIETPGLVARGGTLWPDLAPGRLMEVSARSGDLANDVYRHMDGTYLLTAVHHQGSGGGFTGSEAFNYSNGFEALPQSVSYLESRLGYRMPIPFRPPRVTPRPELLGPHTAIVVGPETEEIWTDNFGRVKVQFLWDRRDKFNEESSCWVRVAQPWAGKRWGATFIPRIGQEVVVDFIEGDPDRPIITGSLYNAEQMPPYLGDGPDGKHKHDPKLSGIKSNSTPEGKGFNELRFDDTKGKEQVFIHAQRSMDQRVGGSHRHTVGGSYHVNVGYEDKDGNKHGDLRVKVKKDLHQTVEGDVHVKIAGAQDLDVDGAVNHIYSDYVAESIANEWAVSAGKIIFEARQSITFVIGGNFVEIGPAGVTVNGTLVKINCAPAICALAQNTALTMLPEDPDGADSAKPGFVSKPSTGGG